MRRRQDRGPGIIPVMRVMGATCGNSELFVAVVEAGVVLTGFPETIEYPSGLECERQLSAVFDDVARVVDEVAPARIALLKPEASYRATHGQFVPRIALETLLRLVASQKGVLLELVSRPAVRSTFHLPKSGRLDSHVDRVIGTPVGSHWRAGRGLAALVALGARDV